ncbi:rifin PIR protein, putative [Plasmodium reichenowi]|uniref:Rifin PIR protein, putative n=1 Tax=Plasmodium reichenowi TaxID=5854 RepID=A0A2P9DC91_PLARE|nr:rifin PIR protein, putative [Plasmodium reichenowi]
MKVHYINILLFALPLNILVTLYHVNTHKKNTFITPHHTQYNRLLCEYELYAPANYDKDPQMKEVMEIFNRQTSQRLREYDECMIEKRKQCKDRCDKESQKIILKDKLEKELMDKFATLQTDIQSDAIPTCVCEKSIADKVEKGCLRCGGILGAAMPELSSIGGGLLYTLNTWKPVALDVATKYATAKGLAFGEVAGDIQGMKVVSFGLEYFGVDKLFPGIYKSFVTTKRYSEVTNLTNTIYREYNTTCMSLLNDFETPTACSKFQLSLRIHLPGGNTLGTPPQEAIRQGLKGILENATKTAEAKTAQVTASKTLAVETAQTRAIETTFMGYQTTIIASIVAIVVIVLIMVIIYLILRYRRKKKIKKKLQYIKLLEE